jgi:hypothetical protein
MKINTGLAIALLTILQGCTGMNVALINEKEAVGKDVDQVVAELKARGLVCSQEYRDKVANTGKLSKNFTLLCTAKDGVPICPESYKVYVDFSPDTRKVVSLDKFSRTNCF